MQCNGTHFCDTANHWPLLPECVQEPQSIVINQRCRWHVARRSIPLFQCAGDQV